MARIESQVVIRAPLDKVFWFLADGDHAPAWHLSVREAHHETAPPIRVGSRLVVKAHAGRREYAWTQEVTGWEPPHSFADRMVPGTGPFRRFEDWGRFEQVPEGVRFTFGTDYALPYGPLGWLVDRLVIAPRVRRDHGRSMEKARSTLEGEARK
ncbi:MAG: SRPBCC family protein [Euryarchaeota archaeon]|nr:SRPBCC family protein [Euryarchaeota archaeon]MDE1835342.1 SRPBCC family protein [Euryarchaeota archaeon]MDE1880763.1 SRPBCC family protein [Euryarchaeota archaeon]MDE2043638.1 SRPBCC family protein [Thermoplasmata archaeon]